ncbi:helicase conserved domain-containing protein [Triangularia verruculosa]|uniref:Helicase conserved domain-containing protein n=1 Tax=Triangularia verruculosa TaxID=2587418 RepID=A0AAN6XKN4_9PEZI|nr:helicase conserved domain-containing protein [Triangularia verruculosa]
MDGPAATAFGIGPHEILADASPSTFPHWDEICEESDLPLALPIISEVFDNANEAPLTELTELGQAWAHMEDWATSCGLQFHSSAEMMAEETTEAGGVQFCCYGTICQTEVKLVGKMLDHLNELDSNGQSIQSFNVVEHETYFMLKFPHSNLLFAQVNQALSPALASLTQLESVEVKAFVDTERIRALTRKAHTPGQAKARVDINVYGSVADANAVGVGLSRAKMYLQDPEHGMDNIEYMNPQLIHFPGFEEPTVIDKPLGMDTEKNKDMRRVREQRDRFDTALSRIYGDLQRYRKLTRIDGTQNQKLLTSLYPHQEAALNFMTQREFGPVPEEFSLWTCETSSFAKTTFYRHKLTGMELHGEQPSECGGGILADETGMGKTLNILALATLTSAEAFQWSKAEADSPRISRSKATLIMVPSTLIMNSWFAEITKHLDNSLRITRYYGKERDVDSQTYLDSDLVFTTYHTVAASLKKKDTSALFRTEWFRVVLDEAHLIKRRETRLFQAASQILANFRWCLTATPIQNRLEELGSLIAFLRIDQLENHNVFKNKIVTPFSFSSDTSMELALRQFTTLLDAICLRRPKHMLNLPEIKERPRYITLSEDERQRYDETLEEMTHWIKEKASRRKDRQDHFGIFQAQLQLRLVCNHGTFQKPFKRYGRRDRRLEREDFLCALGASADVDCSACGITMPTFDALEPQFRRSDHDCGHVICQDCVQPQSKSCPFCYHAASHRAVAAAQGCRVSSGEQRTDDYFHRVGLSSKMDALMKDLQESPGDTKSIVFSCWTRTLDLVSRHLSERNVRHKRIDGRQTLVERQGNMDLFMAEGGIPVLLMSTGVGANGLNLTAANHVYILEPQWNPSVESQAVGRVARLGQKKGVLVTRYLIRGTVEIQMHAQQRDKTKLAEMGWGGR